MGHWPSIEQVRAACAETGSMAQLNTPSFFAIKAGEISQLGAAAREIGMVANTLTTKTATDWIKVFKVISPSYTSAA